MQSSIPGRRPPSSFTHPGIFFSLSFFFFCETCSPLFTSRWFLWGSMLHSFDIMTLNPTPCHLFSLSITASLTSNDASSLPLSNPLYATHLHVHVFSNYSNLSAGSPSPLFPSYFFFADFAGYFCSVSLHFLFSLPLGFLFFPPPPPHLPILNFSGVFLALDIYVA